MILTFYDKNYNAIQNNSTLLVGNSSLKLIKRPVELNTFTCTCKAFEEDILPTFVVLADDRGRYIYGGLAGVPTITNDNKTIINGADLKTIFVSDLILQYSATFTTVGQVLNYIISEWNSQINNNDLSYTVDYEDGADDVELTSLIPSLVKDTYDGLSEIQAYLNAYNLFLDTRLDIVNKRVVFTIGKCMINNINIKLWEYGVKNYGKWLATTNETQGYYVNNDVWVGSTKWVLKNDNTIARFGANERVVGRDFFPVKKRIVTSNESQRDADVMALTELVQSRFSENIEINVVDIEPTFKTKFSVYTKRGQPLYKELPCGELRYNSSGLYGVQIGFRYTTIDFI